MNGKEALPMTPERCLAHPQRRSLKLNPEMAIWGFDWLAAEAVTVGSVKTMSITARSAKTKSIKVESVKAKFHHTQINDHQINDHRLNDHRRGHDSRMECITPVQDCRMVRQRHVA